MDRGRFATLEVLQQRVFWHSRRPAADQTTEEHVDDGTSCRLACILGRDTVFTTLALVIDSLMRVPNERPLRAQLEQREYRSSFAP